MEQKLALLDKCVDATQELVSKNKEQSKTVQLSRPMLETQTVLFSRTKGNRAHEGSCRN